MQSDIKKSYVEIFSTFFPFPKFVICHRVLLLTIFTQKKYVNAFGNA